MNRRQAFPWLQASQASVDPQPWTYSLGRSDYVPFSDFMSNWDYHSDLVVRRQIKIDIDQLCQDIDAVSSDWEYCIQVEVGTGQGTLPRRMAHSLVVPITTRKEPVHIELSIPSSGLSAQLVLNTSLLVSNVGVRRSAIAPEANGARLWHDRLICRLEGEEQRFPMEAVSFQKLFPARPQENALWYVHWDPHHLDRDFHGAIRLYINADHEDFLERVTQQDDATLQMLLGNVMAQIVTSVVSEVNVEELLLDVEPGTLGAQVSNWIRLAFGNVPVEQVRSTLELRPGDFHAAMQSAALL